MPTPMSFPGAPLARTASADTDPSPAAFPRAALAILGGWLVLGLVGARANVLVHLPAPLLPVAIWTPVALAVLGYRNGPALRNANLHRPHRPQRTATY